MRLKTDWRASGVTALKASPPVDRAMPMRAGSTGLSVMRIAKTRMPRACSSASTAESLGGLMSLLSPSVIRMIMRSPCACSARCSEAPSRALPIRVPPQRLSGKTFGEMNGRARAMASTSCVSGTQWMKLREKMVRPNASPLR